MAECAIIVSLIINQMRWEGHIDRIKDQRLFDERLFYDELLLGKYPPKTTSRIISNH